MLRDNRLKMTKPLLLVMIGATAVAPLLFVQTEEATVGLSVVKVAAKIGSLAGVVLLLWQLLLGFRGMLARLIPDYVWVIGVHKEIGKYLVLVILLHPVFITVYYLAKHDRNVLLLEGTRAFQWYVVCGMFALGVIALLVVTSVFLRSRLSRHAWFCIHLSSYIVLPLVFVHSFPIGMTIRGTGLQYVWILLVFVLGAVYVFRVLGRLGVFSVKYTVTATEHLTQDVTHIRMQPVAKPMVPGYSQFAFVRRGLQGSARPFTISGFDRSTGEIAITVAAEGRVSTGLQALEPGQLMYVDGPYGVFGLEAMAGDRPVVMIAGGIGITAFKRMIDKLSAEPQREAHLFYGTRTSGEIIYRDELAAVSHVEIVHVISDEPSYPGERGFVTLDLMRRHLPQPLDKYEFLICGPPVMIKKLEKALSEANVSASQVHHELFGY